jgi:hypothetical protein
MFPVCRPNDWLFSGSEHGWRAVFTVRCNSVLGVDLFGQYGSVYGMEKDVLFPKFETLSRPRLRVFAQGFDANRPIFTVDTTVGADFTAFLA